MAEKYKYMFLIYLYKKLGLNNIEKKLSDAGIKNLDLNSKSVSKYFRLINEIYEDNLNNELREKYNYYFSLDIDKLCCLELEGELFYFLEQTYKLLLFPQVEDEYIYYGPINYNYIAPRDSVVLGFYYDEFSYGDEEFDEKHFQNEVLICDSLNSIQDVLGPKFNVKISIIKYNEFSLNGCRIR